MSHPRHSVREGEEIILDLRPHWWYFVRETVVLAAALIVGIAILAALVWALISYAHWASTHLILTTDRLIYRAGLVTRSGVEIPLERINTVFFSQTLLERMLRSGDLVIESGGELGRQNFSNIRRPLNVQNEIYRQMEDNENRKFDRIGRPAAAAPNASIPEQISQLDDLRRRGVLTEQEFQDKKADLLRRM